MRNLIFGIGLSVLAGSSASADALTADLAYSEKRFDVAYREWSADAAAGDPSAMAALGTLYDTGHGVPQDFARALDWYLKSAEAGSTRGMFNAGAMYDNGRGTPPDRQAAIRWYTMAANQGHGRAAFALGLIYRDGDGVPKDRGNAVRFFRIAASAGIGAAATNLARLNSPAPRAAGTVTAVARPGPSIPNGTTQNDTTQNDTTQTGNIQKSILGRATLDGSAAATFAAQVPGYMRQAANDGRLAQYQVGYALEHGYGVGRDPVKSYVYYLRASTSPDPGIRTAAMRGATEVGKQLSAPQHVEAREMLLDGAS